MLETYKKPRFSVTKLPLSHSSLVSSHVNAVGIFIELYILTLFPQTLRIKGIIFRYLKTHLAKAFVVSERKIAPFAIGRLTIGNNSPYLPVIILNRQMP